MILYWKVINHIQQLKHLFLTKMQITIFIDTDIDEQMVGMIRDGKLEGGYSIDYALNALVSFHNGKEVIVYNFDKYLKLDNRWSGYTIENHKKEIVIKFIR